MEDGACFLIFERFGLVGLSDFSGLVWLDHDF